MCLRHISNEQLKASVIGTRRLLCPTTASPGNLVETENIHSITFITEKAWNYFYLIPYWRESTVNRIQQRRHYQYTNISKFHGEKQ